MKKFSLLTLTLAAMLTFAACSNDAAEEPADKKESTKSNVEEVEATEDNEVNEEEVVTKDTEDTEEVEEVEIIENEEVSEKESPSTKPSNTEVKNEEEVVETEETTVSETEQSAPKQAQGQGYTVQLLADYELTEEEPNRDIIYPVDNEENFMRVEVGEAGNYEHFVENTIEVLKASSNGQQPNEMIDLPFDLKGEASTGYQVQTPNGTVSGFVVQKGSQLVRITMFDDANNSHFNAFGQIAQSINF